MWVATRLARRGKLGLFFYERKLKSHANQTIDQIVKYIEGERRVKANPAFADDTAENASDVFH